MLLKLFLFVLISIFSCVNNLFIPFVIYYQKYGFFKKRNKDFIGCNGWGIIMDGFLAALINIIVLNYLLETKQSASYDSLEISLIFGIYTTIIIHYLMSVFKWKYWIMVKPWHWNSAGYWHMFSMTIQMTFIYYPLIIIWQNPRLLTLLITKYSLTIETIFVCLFALALYLSNKGIRIGRIHINKEPW